MCNDIQDREIVLAATAPLAELAAQVEAVEASYSIIEQTDRRKWELAGLIARLKVSLAAHHRRAAAHRAVAPLATPPALLDVNHLAAVLQKTREAERRHALQGRGAPPSARCIRR